MLGDIDFIFSKEEYPRAIAVLREFGYYIKVPSLATNRHYSRLIKKGSIAAVEIHKELLIEKYQNEFNYSFVEKKSQVIKGVAVLSFANKLNLSIISNQINDDGFIIKQWLYEMPMMFFYYQKKQIQKMR